MPAPLPTVADADKARLAALGAQLRDARKRQRITAVAVAEAAGLSRVTLHRIEHGEPSVAVGAWVAVAAALGLELGLVGVPTPAADVPAVVRIDAYPQLKNLAWALPGLEELEPREAFELYERNWRHVDVGALSADEAALVRALSATFGKGPLLV
jgi:transcriptional regulator with XRE-family HTH domain